MTIWSAALTAGACLAATFALPAQQAHAKDLIVRYDQSQLLRLPRPAAGIIIGNPSIADVAIQEGNLLVVTGKTFGVTNIIALDAERNVIQDQRVLVERDEQRIVNLHRGNLRESYTCTPNCSPTITVGDDAEFFDRITKHAKEKTSFSGGSSDSGAQSSGE